MSITSPVVVDICSSAMIKLGSDPINSLNDDTKEARLCRYQYQRIKNAILRSAPWSFATRRIQLSPISGSLVFGDGNQFQLPADCTKFVRTDCKYDKYTIEGDILITNRSTLNGWYISRDVEPEKFDDSFMEAVACMLAADLCYPITQSTTLKAGLMEQCKMMIDEARSYNSQEVSPQDFGFDDFLESRIGGHEIHNESDFI